MHRDASLSIYFVWFLFVLILLLWSPTSVNLESIPYSFVCESVFYFCLLLSYYHLSNFKLL